MKKLFLLLELFLGLKITVRECPECPVKEKVIEEEHVYGNDGYYPADILDEWVEAGLDISYFKRVNQKIQVQPALYPYRTRSLIFCTRVICTRTCTVPVTNQGIFVLHQNFCIFYTIFT